MLRWALPCLLVFWHNQRKVVTALLPKKDSTALLQQRIKSLPRGGSREEDNARIDAYIEELIATVELSDGDLEMDTEAQEEQVMGIRESYFREQLQSRKLTSSAAIEEKQPEADDAIDSSGEQESVDTAKTTSREEDSTRENQKDTVPVPNVKEPQVESSDRSLLPPRPPNRLYRFLLRQGRIGHVLVLLCVLVVEWLQNFIPATAYFQRFHSDTRRRPLPRPRYRTDTAAPGRTAVSKKQRKKQTRIADEQALQQLRRVGDIQQAKYRHVSLDFMKRHALGVYRTSGFIMPQETEEQDFDEEVETSDALIHTKLEEKKTPKKIEPPLTKKRKRKRKSKSALSSSSNVVGRWVSAGTSSMMSRNLFGAYPGDAPSPQDAASAHGLVELARKYGYGDWDEDEEVDVVSRRRKTKKKKRNKASVEFELGLSSSSSSRSRRKSSTQSVSPRTSTPRLSPRPLRAEEESTILTSRRRNPKMVRPAMQLLNEVVEEEKRRRKDPE